MEPKQRRTIPWGGIIIFGVGFLISAAAALGYTLLPPAGEGTGEVKDPAGDKYSNEETSELIHQTAR